MIYSFYQPSVDHLIRDALTALIDDGETTEPSKGTARELRGVTLALLQPRARLSRSESKGRVFSALGELCWYLSGSSDANDIAYYISDYAEEAEDDGVIHGAYGPRLLDYDGANQLDYVIDRLRTKPHSRKAVIQLFDHEDVTRPYRNVPCTCTLQFFVRGGMLEACVHMRSNDAYKGLPHDVFAFTMLQEFVACSLGYELGRYTHMVGSLHLYERNVESAQAYLDEGLYPTIEMPSMPPVDPAPAVHDLLGVEAALRMRTVDPSDAALSSNAYWHDLGLLLAVFALHRQGRRAEIPALRSRFHSSAYDVFLDDKFPGASR